MDQRYERLESKMDAGFSSIHADITEIKHELSSTNSRLDKLNHFARSNDSAIVDEVPEFRK